MTHDGSAQIIIVNSSETSKEAIKIHKAKQTPSTVLSRVLTAASMMGSTLKDKGNTVTVNFRGDGKCGHVLAVSDYMGNVKGYIQNADIELPTVYGKINVKEAVGQGTLNVVKDTGEKEPYIGIIPLKSGEIAEDIANYYAESEQIPTVCALGETFEGGKLTASGGYLIMLLPMADDVTVDKIEKNVKTIPSVSEMLSKNYSNEQIAQTVFEGIEFDFFDEYEVGYCCDCSRERMGNALLTLNPMDLYNILIQDKIIEVGCQFCNKKYKFTGEDIEQIRKKKKAEKTGNK